MKWGVVVSPGANCEADAYHALKDVLEFDTRYLWHGDADLHGVDAVLLPGGFTYGDYLRPGALARFSPVVEAIADFAERGGIVAGICNGFQVLCEAGLLPGMLRRNIGLRFRCGWVRLCVESRRTPFTSGLQEGDRLNLPIAHGEGNYYIDELGLRRLQANEQIVFRYVDEEGTASPEGNPNGSTANIAGVCNERGNVLGMMPHPERAVERLLGGEDGRRLFLSTAGWLAGRGMG